MNLVFRYFQNFKCVTLKIHTNSFIYLASVKLNFGVGLSVLTHCFSFIIFGCNLIDCYDILNESLIRKIHSPLELVHRNADLFKTQANIWSGWKIKNRYHLHGHLIFTLKHIGKNVWWYQDLSQSLCRLIIMRSKWISLTSVLLWI